MQTALPGTKFALPPEQAAIVARARLVALLNAGSRRPLMLLARLSRGGMMLAPLDRRGEWYRYHALFAELLAP